MVVNLIVGGVFPCSEVGMIIKDFCLKIKMLPNCSIIFTSRRANNVAHCLAKLGLSSVEGSFWMEECTLSVYPVVLGDRHPRVFFS